MRIVYNDFTIFMLSTQIIFVEMSTGSRKYNFRANGAASGNNKKLKNGKQIFVDF